MQHRYVLLFSIALLMAGCAEQPASKIKTQTATTPATTKGDNGLDGDEEQAILSYHNQARASVSVQPLSWSTQLAQHAASRATAIAAQGCVIPPSRGKNKAEQDSRYGESVFIGESKQEHATVIEAAKAWESEKINYTGNALNKAIRSQAGHYTQMIWRTTKQLGCAKAECTNEWVVVCNYDPAGNRLKEKPY